MRLFNVTQYFLLILQTTAKKASEEGTRVLFN